MFFLVAGLASSKGGIVIKNPFFMANGGSGEGLPPPIEAVKAHPTPSPTSTNNNNNNNIFSGPKSLAAFNWCQPNKTFCFIVTDSPAK